MSSPSRTAAIQELIELLTPLLRGSSQPDSAPTNPTTSISTTTTNYERILAGIQRLTHELVPGTPLFTEFHDGQVHDPLGGGAYAFQNDVVGPVMLALLDDEKQPRADPDDAGSARLPTRPIIIHAGLQPNNSPHVGTLVVFSLAFAFARAIRDRMLEVIAAAGTEFTPPSVTVLITFVDTAPVKGRGVEFQGVHYQRSYRDVPEALGMHKADYDEVLRLLSGWSGITFDTAVQSDLFSHPAMPSLLDHIISHRGTLGPQLSPKHGCLAIRAACPVRGCGLVEKHGRLNEYDDDDDGHGTIRFHCPAHGPHAVRLARREEVARLEANTPTRNLLRSMVHLLDTSAHHIRVTGADYTGMYQETLLYRPLAAWSAATGAGGRTPHILYAPLITDWSGAKLSKSLYVRDGAYAFMRLVGTEAFCSYAQLRGKFSDEGLRKVWEEVQRWVADPKKLFRTFSLAYLQGVMLREEPAE